MPKTDHYRFFNLPRKYGLSDYKEAADCIIRRYSAVDNLAAVYNWGGQPVPGISDMDIIIIFEKKESALPFLYRSFYFLDSKTRYLAAHPFFYIDAESFRSIRYIYQADFKLLNGSSIDIKTISSSDAYYTSIALLSDIIVRHYPRDFLEQMVDKNIDVRATLLRLNSLKYSIKILEHLTKEKNKEWNSKAALIEKLRKDWFKSADFELLMQLNWHSVEITMDIIQKFRDFITEKSIVKIHNAKSMKYDGIKNRAFFVKGWDKERALKEMSEMIKKKEKHYSILPIELAAQLVEYSRQKGLVSEYIRNHMTNGLDYKLKHLDVVRKRIAIINQQANLALKLKHSDFVSFFDFGYRNTSGINNIVLLNLAKLRRTILNFNQYVPFK